MGLFDSFDDDDKPRGRHWLDGWRVQLPVNKQGKLNGAANQNWHPADSYKPWYIVRGREVSFRKPDKGAQTGNTSSSRCELNQLDKWSNSEIEFSVDVKNTSPTGTIVYQCRSGKESHELIQLRVYKKENEFSIRMNENARQDRRSGKVDLRKPMRVRAEVKRNKTISLWINGEKFESPMRHDYEPKSFNHKIGVYGGGNNKAETKVTGLKWS